MIFSFFLLLVSICITGKAGHTKGRAAQAALPSEVFFLLVVTIVRTFVAGRALGTGVLALGAAALGIVGIALRTVVCIVCICRVGRIIRVVRTHSRMTSCNKYLQP